ncbi:endonuclease domain-containing protein [Catenuloplanes sp. NPDC051500]|uniref:endonuclease domain-containing protein n=1 Tax=Catenuloplanes sp. NPDC051500 TaxID=3363959 RepID=UPI003789BBCF
MTSFGGLPVTTRERTAFDLGRLPDRHQAVMALDAMLFRRLVTVDRLAAFATSRPRWIGVALFSARLAEAEPLAESPMETLVRLLITDAGLPRPVAQHEILTRGARFPSRVDLAYPDLRIAIEYEGDHHRERDTFRKDIARERRLEEADWLVLRLTADDVLRTPAETVRLITSARERRRARTVAPPRGK